MPRPGHAIRDLAVIFMQKWMASYKVTVVIAFIFCLMQFINYIT